MSREQAATRDASAWEVMGTNDFRKGFEDRRAGRPPRFDQYDSWNYERGRLFASIAPLNMPLKINRKLNPKAVRLFEAAHERRYLI
jgi:hypothetical protein